MTKSFFITMIVAIFLGAVLGNFLFEQYKLEDKSVVREVNSIYFIMEGSYGTLEQAKEATKDIEVKLITKEDANYVVYLAITKSNDNLEKLEKIYEDLKLNTTIKKMSIDNEEFLATLEQMDLLIDKTTSQDEILAVNEVVLANYEELIGTGM